MAKRRMARRASAAAQRSSIEKSVTSFPRSATPPTDSSALADVAPSTPSIAFAEWLTVERILWGALIVVAAGLRLLDLGYFPLNDAEAQLANASLQLLRGETQSIIGGGPFLVGLNALVLLILGANDLTARLAPALAGILLVALTYRLRDELGRWGAWITGLLFTLSATFLYHARMVNGELIAVTACYATLLFLWEFLRTQSARALYLSAFAAAIALTAGQATYTIWLCVLGFALVVLGLRATRQIRIVELDALLNLARHSREGARYLSEITRNAALTFLLTALISATAALVNPLGLQATADLAAGWLAQWSGEANQPSSYFLQLFITYELLPLVFGLGGMLYGLARGERLANFTAWWTIAALSMHTFMPVKSPSALLTVLVPLILMAGQTISRLLVGLARRFSWMNEGLFISLGLLTCAIFGVNLSNYAQTTERNYLIVLAISLVMLVLVGLIVGGFTAFISAETERAQQEGDESNDTTAPDPMPAWQQGVVRAIQVWGLILAIGLGALMTSAAINLSLNEADDTREPLVEAPLTMEARDLKPMLEDMSNRWLGDPRAAPIAADANVGPGLQWYLRDFRNVRYFREVPGTTSEPLVIVAAQSQQQPGFPSHAAQRVRWRWQKPLKPLVGVDFWRWVLYRGLHDVLPSYDIIVYAQSR